MADIRLALLVDDPGRIPLRIAGEERLGLSVVGEVIDGKTPEYEGDYTVIPTFQQQTLETRYKKMADDVTVEPIPVFQTTNPAGGYTVNIGGI